jgi:LPXTG-site transpeptidase (sortase) family protein
MDKKQAIKLAKIAAVLYMASFLIFNWAEVSWIFNYKKISSIIDDFLNPYPSIDALAINKYFYPNSSQDLKAISQQNSNSEVKTAYTNKQNTLEIPKINISAPIIFSQSTDKDSLMKDLDSGVIYYPGSAYPGKDGQIIILGHSAPVGWPKTKYEWVFSDLNNLEEGDRVLIDLNNKQYTYIVKKKTIIAKGADVPQYQPLSSNSVLTLISCWPPGKDYQRIAVQAELEK